MADENGAATIHLSRSVYDNVVAGAKRAGRLEALGDVKDFIKNCKQVVGTAQERDFADYIIAKLGQMEKDL